MLYLMAVDTPEEEAFITKLYSEYEQMMYKVAFNILNNNYDAEDTVHEVFLNIIRKDRLANLKKLQTSGLKAYLIITVKNAAYKCYNSHRNRIAENIDDLYSLREELPPRRSCFPDTKPKIFTRRLTSFCQATMICFSFRPSWAIQYPRWRSDWKYPKTRFVSECSGQDKD